jgi:hypothetical protein
VMGDERPMKEGEKVNQVEEKKALPNGKSG